MTDQNPKKEAKPLNPYYALLPFIFKTTGVVRRTEDAPRFSRRMGMQAMRAQLTLTQVTHLTVADHQTIYVLSREQTKVIQQGNIIEDMILNGWRIWPTTEANIELLPQLYQGEMF